MVEQLTSRVSSLQELELHMNNIGDMGAIALASPLVSKNISLKILDISCNDIGDKGGVALAQALAENTNLEKLSLQNNRLGNVSCSILADQGMLRYKNLDL